MNNNMKQLCASDLVSVTGTSSDSISSLAYRVARSRWQGQLLVSISRLSTDLRGYVTCC